MWTLDRDLAYARHYPAVSWSRSFARSADQLGHWHATHGDPDWSARRSRLGMLLSEADRLRNIADLVGVTALPAAERLVLVAGRLARLAVLQQSALSSNDATCGAAKQTALVEAVLKVHEVALQLSEQGVPASVIETFDFGPLVRAKEDTAPDDATGVRRITAALVDDLRRLAPP